jgi:2-dehydro-3-deoxyphosphooctonate aldolase (KDO 8-P synthase)
MTPNHDVAIGPVTFANDAPLALIAGPCQLESRQHAFDMAGALKEMTGKSSASGWSTSRATTRPTARRSARTRGAGLEAALPIFADLTTAYTACRS